MAKKSPWARQPELEASGELDSAPNCPNCGKTLDGFSSAELKSQRPREGDMGICLYCGTISKYTGSPLRLVPVEGDELILVRANPLVRRALRVVAQWQKKRGG
jgi:hypothetical protein